MTQELRDTYIFRAESVLNNLKNFNSGADVHRVGNLRNIATGLITLWSEGDSDPILIQMLTDLEVKQLEFIKWKFQHS